MSIEQTVDKNRMKAFVSECLFSVFSSGGSVFAAELERSWPHHVWRTGSGGNLQGSSGQKRENALPVRPHAALHQTPRRTLRLQVTHLCEKQQTNKQTVLLTSTPDGLRVVNLQVFVCFTLELVFCVRVMLVCVSLSGFSAPLWCWSKAPETLWASASLSTNNPNSLRPSRWDLLHLLRCCFLQCALSTCSCFSLRYSQRVSTVELDRNVWTLQQFTE